VEFRELRPSGYTESLEWEGYFESTKYGVYGLWYGTEQGVAVLVLRNMLRVVLGQVSRVAGDNEEAYWKSEGYE